LSLVLDSHGSSIALNEIVFDPSKRLPISGSLDAQQALQTELLHGIEQWFEWGERAETTLKSDAENKAHAAK
jgi:hypothetical protein